MAEKEKGAATPAPAEEAAAPKGQKAQKEQKKKGKLPMLIALVAVLGGGGFFAMKMKGGGKAKIEMGEEVQLEELLVNLKEPNAYLRTEIALQMAKGFDKTKFEPHMKAVRDAIILILTTKSMAELKTLDGKLELKKEIADSVNAVLNEGEAKPSAEKATDRGSEKADKKTSAHSDWDSETGPVLKVYFSNFATQ